LAGNSWAASRSRGQVRWHASRTVGRKSRPFVITGLLIVVLAIAVREQLPRRRASSLAVVLLALLGVALILAACRDADAQWRESQHLERVDARHRVLVDHRNGHARAA